MEQELANYIELHKTHQQNISACKYINNIDCGSIAQTIHNNIKEMSNENLLQIFNSIISADYVKQELLFYELEKYSPTEQLSFANKDEFILLITNILSKFRNCSYGHLLEDTIWTLHDKSSSKYPVKSNELLFENSIHLNETKVDQIEEYLKLIRRYINRLSSDFKVTDRIIEDPHNDICWIILKCKSDKF